MTLYLVRVAPNRLLRKQRAQGWRHVGLDDIALTALSTRIMPLKGLGVSRVYSSDLHREDAEVIAKLLGLPSSSHFSLRPFNIGRHHAKPEGNIEVILEGLVPQWVKNPAIPIRGGDSWASYEKRFLARVKQILKGKTDAILVTDDRGMRSVLDMSPKGLLVTASKLNPTKIYQVRLKTDGPSIQLERAA